MGRLPILAASYFRNSLFCFCRVSLGSGMCFSGCRDNMCHILGRSTSRGIGCSGVLSFFESLRQLSCCCTSGCGLYKVSECGLSGG